MTKRLLLLPAALLLTLSGCWWNSKTPSQATATEQVDPETEAKVITHIANEQQFETLLKESSKLIIVKFTAPWCSACKDLHPHFVNAAIKGVDYMFTSVNVDSLPNMAQQYGIVGIPTLLFIKNGKEIVNSRIEGAEIASGDELLTKIKNLNTTEEPAIATEQANLIAQKTL